MWDNYMLPVEACSNCGHVCSGYTLLPSGDATWHFQVTPRNQQHPSPSLSVPPRVTKPCHVMQADIPLCVAGCRHVGTSFGLLFHMAGLVSVGWRDTSWNSSLARSVYEILLFLVCWFAFSTFSFRFCFRFLSCLFPWFYRFYAPIRPPVTVSVQLSTYLPTYLPIHRMNSPASALTTK
jgi:hypothetical protein